MSFRLKGTDGFRNFLFPWYSEELDWCLLFVGVYYIFSILILCLWGNTTTLRSRGVSAVKTYFSLKEVSRGRDHRKVTVLGGGIGEIIRFSLVKSQNICLHAKHQGNVWDQYKMPANWRVTLTHSVSTRCSSRITGNTLNMEEQWNAVSSLLGYKTNPLISNN